MRAVRVWATLAAAARIVLPGIYVCKRPKGFSSIDLGGVFSRLFKLPAGIHFLSSSFFFFSSGRLLER